MTADSSNCLTSPTTTATRSRSGPAGSGRETAAAWPIPSIKHSGKASALLLGYGPCKIAVQTELKTAAGFYKLTGYVRAINLRPGTYDRTAVVSFEPKGKEIMTDLPGGSYGWRKFELVRKFDEAYPKNLLYIYLFGSGRMWLDDLVLTRLDGAGHKEGLTMSEPEEQLKGFAGAGGLQCPGCGLKVDPKAAKCPVCGEPTTGLGEYGKAVALYETMAGLIDEAKGRGIDVLYWQAAAIPMRVGLGERWNNFPEERPETLQYVSAARGRGHRGDRRGAGRQAARRGSCRRSPTSPR